MLSGGETRMKSLELHSTEFPAGIDWNPCMVGFCFLLIEKGRADFKSGSFWRLLSEGDAVALKRESQATLHAMPPNGFTVSYFHFFLKTYTVF
jgi:hypothetical protein